MHCAKLSMIALSSGLALSACESAVDRSVRASKQGGDFCDDLTAAIHYGEDSFREVRGSRIDSNRFRSNLAVGDAFVCFVDDFFDDELICRYFDAPWAERNFAMQRFRDLEADVRSCLIEEDRFAYGYDRGGVEDVRYSEYSVLVDRTWFDDTSYRDQDVRVHLDCDDDGCSVNLSVESR